MSLKTLKHKYIGDKSFYSMVLAIAIPLMIQNGFTNFVNLLDNVMVGRLGTEQMSGVSIANQLIFIFNLCNFGAISGAGIYGAQYFGKEDNEGVRNTLRYKIILGLLLVITVTLIYFLKGEALIKLFLGGSEDGADKIATLNYGFSYLKIMLWGLPGFMITQAFASTLREGGETILPMKAGIIAITTNLVFNWILIFGNLGFPTLGVQGAAIATVISRYVEASIVIIGAIKKKFDFMKGLLSRITVPIELAKKISTAAAPLLFNECLWSLGMTFLLKCYSTRGLNAVAGYNIANTLYNVLSVTFMAVGSSVGIIVGQLLGAGKKEEAVETARKMIAFAVMVGTIAGLILVSISPFFPKLYNTNDAAKTIATKLLITMGCCLPLNGFKHSTYFTLRSGGKILVTFIFDSGFLWTVSAPIAFLVSTFTNLGVVQIFLCIQAGDLIKCAIGTYLVKKRVWVNKIID